MKTSYENDKEANRWNHRPNGPVTLNPLLIGRRDFLQFFAGTLHIGLQHLQPLLHASWQ